VDSPYLLVTAFAVTAYLTAFLTVLAHELGHAAAAMWFQLPFSHITLGVGPTLFENKRLVIKGVPLGGELHPTEDLMVPFHQIGLVALAGPLTNLALATAALSYLIFAQPERYCWAVAVIATCFNLSMFFDNAMMRKGTDGDAFWTYMTRLLGKQELSRRLRTAFNTVGVTVQLMTSGAFLGWAALAASSPLRHLFVS
jgi:membrane-associated protease RseP (regulator of RpoE activity)